VVASLYFGMFTYALMLPVMFYRFIFAENVAVTAIPTLAILAAPASLFLTGYLSLVDDPQPLPVILLMGISVLMTAIVYVAFIRLLALPFSPGFSAYTFPLVIGATALFKAVEQFEARQIRQKLINQTHGAGGLRIARCDRSCRLRDCTVRSVRVDALVASASLRLAGRIGHGKIGPSRSAESFQILRQFCGARP
jgi:Voltage-dependent anion channel